MVQPHSLTRTVSLVGITHNRYGISTCPECAADQVEVRKTKPWDHTTDPPSRIRYLLCTGCDHRFKSIET